MSFFSLIRSLLSSVIKPSWTVYRNVEHGPIKADVYLLNKGVHPVIMWLHGGGFSSGDKSVYEGKARKYAAAGFHSVAINYRLATFDDASTQWPAQIDDVRTAIKWIRQAAPAWRIDPSRIGVAGDSAGAHLALMLGTTEDRPNCILNMFGPCNLSREPLAGFIAALPVFNRQSDAQVPWLYASACPVGLMNAYFPPTMTIHGMSDETVPFAQAIELDGRLSQLGVEHKLVPFDGGHEFGKLSTMEQAKLEMQGLDWFKKYLRP